MSFLFTNFDKKLVEMKSKKTIGLILIMSTIFLLNEAFSDKKTSYTEKHKEIVLRNIGHQLLLHANDSTSRVLPVKKINDNLYQLEFQTDFSFVTDSLISLVDKQLKASNLPSQYIVSVLNCTNLALVFGYEVSNKTGNLIPCSGRIQPKDCYLLQIEFLQNSYAKYLSYFLLLIPLAFVSVVIKRKYFPRKENNELIENQSITRIGNFLFDEELGLLKNKEQEIQLSEKEVNLLKLLTKNVNQTTERELLMKEIWEDGGVIVVNRSLDVLVSKMRKKLEAEPNIKIVNVHGKGYKLTINQ